MSCKIFGIRFGLLDIKIPGELAVESILLEAYYEGLLLSLQLLQMLDLAKLLSCSQTGIVNDTPALSIGKELEQALFGRTVGLCKPVCQLSNTAHPVKLGVYAQSLLVGGCQLEPCTRRTKTVEGARVAHHRIEDPFGVDDQGELGTSSLVAGAFQLLRALTRNWNLL